MDYIQVTKPGTYKRKATYPPGRYCQAECGIRLSIYNEDAQCSSCTQKQFDTEYGDKK